MQGLAVKYGIDISEISSAQKQPIAPEAAPLPVPAPQNIAAEIPAPIKKTRAKKQNETSL